MENVDDGIADTIINLNRCSITTVASCSGLKADHGKAKLPYVCIADTSTKLAEKIRKAGWILELDKKSKVTYAYFYRTFPRGKEDTIQPDFVVLKGWEKLEKNLCS